MHDNVSLSLAQKILARASGIAEPKVGEIITCDVDLALMHDSSGPRRVKDKLAQLGAKVWDPDKVVLVSDHFAPATDVDSAQILALTREWAKDETINNFYDMQGICHTVVAEKGHLRPGIFAVGGDSHSSTGGAYGCFMIGIGATEMAGVLATGQLWVQVPSTVKLEWHGMLNNGVCAKDIMLFLCRELGMNNHYKVMEFCGPAIQELSLLERTVLCNMSAELGAKTGIIAPDNKLNQQLTKPLNEKELKHWQSDLSSAVSSESYRFDAASLSPQVAAPHSPANSDAAGHFAGQKIDQAYIGACTGAKLSDIQMAASILRGQKVSPSTRLLLAPASIATTQAALKDGSLSTLVDAGAIILPSGCGACAGFGAGVLAKGEVCISSTARNFKGRMGSSESQVYLASPMTVAASAIKGEICDPRYFL